MKREENMIYWGWHHKKRSNKKEIVCILIEFGKEILPSFCLKIFFVSSFIYSDFLKDKISFQFCQSYIIDSL